MRALVILGVAGLMALGVAGTAQASSSSDATYVGCAEASPDWIAAPKVRPTTCDTWYPWLSHAESAGKLHKLRWTSWGGVTATATGQMRFKTYDRTPVRITLSRPRSVFSMRAYTRMRVTTGGHSSTMELPWGYDLWPEL
jgi:hypothetical protein